MNPKGPEPRHIIISVPRIKEKILKATRKQNKNKPNYLYKPSPTRLSGDILVETS